MSDEVEREFEQVKRGIAEFKSSGTGLPDRGGPSSQEGSAPTFAGPEVFACEENYISETGYGEELRCICRDPDVKPWVSCPIHGNVID